MDYEKQGVAVFILDGSNTGTSLERDKNGNPVIDDDGAYMTKTKSIIAQFRRHKGPAIMVTKTDVIGEGLDFSFASRGILLAPTFTVSETQQFARRLYRRGQKNNVRFRTLQTAGTIEQAIGEYAIRKNIIIRELLDGKPLTKKEQEMLNEDVRKIKQSGFFGL